jgi:hypothetical protein
VPVSLGGAVLEQRTAPQHTAPAVAADPETCIALRWLEDYASCLLGIHGEAWQIAAEHVTSMGYGHWWEWRNLRQKQHSGMGEIPGSRSVPSVIAELSRVH